LPRDAVTPHVGGEVTDCYLVLHDIKAIRIILLFLEDQDELDRRAFRRLIHDAVVELLSVVAVGEDRTRSGLTSSRQLWDRQRKAGAGLWALVGHDADRVVPSGHVAGGGQRDLHTCLPALSDGVRGGHPGGQSQEGQRGPAIEAVAR